MEFSVRVLDGIISVTLDNSLSAETQSAIAHQWQHLQADASAEASAMVHLAISEARDPVLPEAKLVIARDQEHAPDLLASNLTLTGIRALAGSAFYVPCCGARVG